MASTTAQWLLWVAALGVVMVAAQIGGALLHLRRRPRPARELPGISLLKPLCGLDDALMANLQTFSCLDYPRYEVLLGVKDRNDPAYHVACQAAARWPAHMRVVLQRSAPGLNPKVNQLITLAARARHDWMVISDSNVRVDRDYLAEIAAHLQDERVGVVTHPIAGCGETSWGALLDNLHLCAFVGPGMIMANRLGGNLTVGKSMAFRRAELRAIGGFEALKDVLAEDFLMGRLLASAAGKRVAVAHRAVVNVCARRSLRGFMQRYTRWNIMQRTMVGRGLYTTQLLLNPVPFALVAFGLDPDRHTFAALIACAATKAALECAALRALRPGQGRALHVLVLPLKDLLLLGVWLYGMFKTEVEWRGTRLMVLEGTRLSPCRRQAQWQAQASS